MQDQINFCDDAPDEIWDTIVAMVDENRAPGRNLPQMYREGYNYLRRWRAASRTDLPALRRDFPVLCPAHMLYCNQKSEKWIVEAGLLSEVDPYKLSEYICKDTAIIEKYHDLFFNVRSKLQSRGYILNQILLPAFSRGVSERDYDLMYKTIAYCLGWSVFSEFIDYKALSDDSRMRLQEGFRDNMIKLGYVASRRLEVNNFNATLVIDSCIKMQEMEREARLNMAQGGSVVNLLGELLVKCKTVIAAPSPTLMLDEPRAEGMINGMRVIEYGQPIPAEENHGKA